MNNGFEFGAFVDLRNQGSEEDTNVGMDTYTGFENVEGSQFTDAITGDEFDNVLWGRGRGDGLIGGAGNDTIFGGSGSDIIEGGAGNSFPSLMADATLADHGWNADIIARSDDPASASSDHGDVGDDELPRIGDGIS